MNPGRELDVLVAEKVLGLVITYVPERAAIGARLEDVPYVDVGTDDERYLPAYSTYIGAAWEVVEKLTPRHFTRIELTFEIDTWSVAFGQWGSSAPRAEATAAFLPHAICLAALKAVGA